MRRCWSVCVLLLPFCAGCGPATTGVEELRLRTVTLPDGQQIRAEVLVRPDEMARGMMYRDSLPKGRGMLFIHDKPAPYRYWMHDVKIPLDIIFMDEMHKIVEISADTPPCTSDPKDCPTYGGHHFEQFVLELGGGEARRLGLVEGQSLTF
jgi:uncharacterized protein